ncbi:MAG: redoxin domain-containing protein [Planctomycetota bacterium]
MARARRPDDLLREAAAEEAAWRPKDNDPPTYPRCLYNVLGETYLGLDSPRLAQAAFEQALVALPNNGWSWAGLARAHAALGHRDRAAEAYAHMLHVWSDAEPGIAQASAARALGLEATPRDPSPRPQRNYARTTLEPLGPNTWQPYAAPALAALDATGAPVQLADFAGKNVLLVFYLSDQCVHCVEQLQAIRKRASDFASRDTVLLAISSDPPERNAAGDLQDLASAGVRLLSDDAAHDNAIRFRSYDEFEDLELHSTMLIDRRGRVRWVRTGGAPFVDLGFLLAELDRIEAIERAGRLEAVGSAAHAR